MNFFVIKRRDIIRALSLVFALAFSIFLVNATGSFAVYANKTIRKRPISCVATGEKKIAITFDASWGADNTSKILDILTDYNIKATYFVVGFWAENYRSELKTLSDSGRIEVGTNSNTHRRMTKLSKNEVKLELEMSKSIIESVTGKQVDLFRAPFGEYSDALIETVDESGFYSIGWNIDSNDSGNLTAGEISAQVISKATPGSIIVMRNDGKKTLAALPLIIEGLKAAGYSFSTIGEMILRENFSIDNTGKQIRSK